MRDSHRAHSRHPRDDRERPLKLRLGDEAAAAVYRRKPRGVTRGGDVERRGPNANPIERDDQHAIARERTQRDEHVGAIAAGGAQLAEDPLPEGNLLQPFRALAHVGCADRLGQPRGIDWLLIDAPDLPRGVVRQIGAGEQAGPETSRPGRGRHAVGVDVDPSQGHRQVERGAIERHRADVPLAKRAGSRGRQRLEPIGARRGIRHPQAQDKRTPRRIELSDGVVERRDPALVHLEQLLDESIRTRHFFAHDRFPHRHDVITLGRGNDTVGAHAQAARERRERRRGPLVEPRQQQRVIGEELQRLIVERRQAVAQE